MGARMGVWARVRGEAHTLLGSAIPPVRVGELSQEYGTRGTRLLGHRRHH
jgi:hypothetical protein